MSEFWFDDGTPRKAKELYYNDGGVVRTLREAWYTDAGGVPRRIFVAFTPGLTGGGTTYEYNDGTLSGTVTMTAQTDGRLTIVDAVASRTFQWGAPTTTSIGSNYWVRFTLTGSTATGSGTGAPSASTGWLQLSSARAVSVTATKVGSVGARIVSGTYTVEIATDAAGASIVATATGYTLRVVATPP